MTKLNRTRVLAYRYQVNGLDTRLPAGELVAASRSGLQDSAPRAAVLSLHARVEGVQPDDWSNRSLTQVWGPRGAIYLIPKEDLGVFTLGMLPRDEERLDELQRQARRVLRALDGRPQRPGSILDAVSPIRDLRELRWVSATGWFLPIWDGSSTAVYPAEPAETDVEESRLELARRFLHYLGPSTTKGFQWWSGAGGEDATKTMSALGPELATVDVDGEEVLMLAADVAQARTAPQPAGLHLLPPDDVYISRLCGPLLLNDAELNARLYPQAPLPGALVHDGEVVATWRRRGRRLTINPFPGLDVATVADAVKEAAGRLPIADVDTGPSVDWYDD